MRGGAGMNEARARDRGLATAGGWIIQRAIYSGVCCRIVVLYCVLRQDVIIHARETRTFRLTSINNDGMSGRLSADWATSQSVSGIRSFHITLASMVSSPYLRSPPSGHWQIKDKEL